MMNPCIKPFPRRVAAHLPLAAAVWALIWAGAASGEAGSPAMDGPQSEAQQHQSQSPRRTMGSQGAQSGAPAMQQEIQGTETAYLSEQQAQAFERLDKDSDGLIDRHEAKDDEQLSQQFDQIDAYSNDRITRAEFSAFEVKAPQTME